MSVQDIMHAGERNAVISTGDCFRDVLEEMSAKKLGAVCVVENDKLVGLITDGDVRRLILKTQLSLPNLFLVNADKLMTPEPRTIAPDTGLEDALALFEKHEFWVVPVTDENKRLVGLLHLHSLLKAMIPKQ